MRDGASRCCTKVASGNVEPDIFSKLWCSHHDQERVQDSRSGQTVEELVLAPQEQEMPR